MSFRKTSVLSSDNVAKSFLDFTKCCLFSGKLVFINTKDLLLKVRLRPNSRNTHSCADVSVAPRNEFAILLFLFFKFLFLYLGGARFSIFVGSNNNKERKERRKSRILFLFLKKRKKYFNNLSIVKKHGRIVM